MDGSRGAKQQQTTRRTTAGVFLLLYTLQFSMLTSFISVESSCLRVNLSLAGTADPRSLIKLLLQPARHSRYRIVLAFITRMFNIRFGIDVAETTTQSLLTQESQTPTRRVMFELLGIDVVHPFTLTLLTHQLQTTRQEFEHAVAAAREALKTWSRTSISTHHHLYSCKSLQDETCDRCRTPFYPTYETFKTGNRSSISFVFLPIISDFE
ncbi:hypothetical protein M422DRAFT_47099 [Sphaerobolus stellatus SS14]|uniref:Uncharacterized protein n=1 Tax=Sphaerobolus stellatus (strain SS14) TaxID=990650 RepID=A0A0C9VRC0_SPHS4|nr:hypothetical protein M422DRAFT_47099 [Sphaerobolus stellatus SS14]